MFNLASTAKLEGQRDSICVTFRHKSKIGIRTLDNTGCLLAIVVAIRWKVRKKEKKNRSHSKVESGCCHAHKNRHTHKHARTPLVLISA